ncbi:Tetratricopeptide repeat protein 1 [Halotydeus destructor]|nr:Tetratricopeptide repeat protein 1 [Halotydeus destructor]
MASIISDDLNNEETFFDANEENDNEEFCDASDELLQNDHDSDQSDTESRKEIESSLTVQEIDAKCQRSQIIKIEANVKFKKEEYDAAIVLYTEALKICPLVCQRERSVLYSNRATANARFPESEHITKRIVKDCTKAIEADPTYLKPLLRRAQVYRQIGNEKLDDSLADYNKILEISPASVEAKFAVLELNQEISARNEKLKNEMIGKLKDLGNLVLRPFGLSTENFQLNQNPDTGGYSVNFSQN